ncbi:MAG: small, acid-soluble spore protein, alpha/beta type [Syntrophomonas sp.]
MVIRNSLTWRCINIPSKKKKKKVLTEKDLMKIEIARELGIWEQVEKDGWESLTNAMCGKVGGIMSKRMKSQKAEENGLSTEE